MIRLGLDARARKWKENFLNDTDSTVVIAYIGGVVVAERWVS